MRPMSKEKVLNLTGVVSPSNAVKSWVLLTHAVSTASLNEHEM